MNKTVYQLKCPNCGFQVKAELQQKFNKFVLYFCPECSSNVVFYDNKVDIISDDMVLKLKKRLKFIGSTYSSNPRNRVKKGEKRVISDDDVLNLHILLETEDDFDKILAKL